MTDPFVCHLKDDLSPALHAALSQKPPKLLRETTEWPYLGGLLYFRAEVGNSVEQQKERDLLDDGQSFAKTRLLPDIPKDLNYNNLSIKPQILPNITKLFSSSNESKEITPVQRELLQLICNYHVSI